MLFKKITVFMLFKKITVFMLFIAIFKAIYTTSHFYIMIVLIMVAIN